jgi:hypothetical protein
MNCSCGRITHARGLCTTCLSREYRKKNPERVKAVKDAWYAKNRDKEIAKAKKWQKENPEKAKAATSKYVKNSNYTMNRYNNDIQFRLRVILRNRLLQSIKTDAKAGSAVQDLGCSINEFKDYLESKFVPGMTWENMGDWHIDHIHPLSKYDLGDVEQFKQACHYTNLQPLWKEDNLRKGSMLIPKYSKGNKAFYYNQVYEIDSLICDNVGRFTGGYVLKDEKGHLLSGVLENQLSPISSKVQ